MTQKCKVSSFLVAAVMRVCGHLGLAQSALSGPTAQEDELFAAVEHRLNEAADKMLANAVPSAPMAELAGDCSMRTQWSSALLPVPTKFKEALTTRSNIKRSLARLDLLRPIIEPELVRAGLPVELSGMVQVESGAQTLALSPRGARGLWQLMPDTARRYGLLSLHSATNGWMPTSPLALRPVICAPYMHNSGTGLWYLPLRTLASRRFSAPLTAAVRVTFLD